MPDNLASGPDIRPDNSAVPNIRLNPPLKQGFYLLTSVAHTCRIDTFVGFPPFFSVATALVPFTLDLDRGVMLHI